MTHSSVPDIEERFLEPKGWRWHSYKNRNGMITRFGSIYPESRIPSAVVVVLPGRTEFIEKYFELSRELASQNMAVWVLDWHGQGQSERYKGRLAGRGHSQDFELHADDLHDFILSYVKHACVHPDVGRIPMVMLAHSMGANIGMRFLHKYPGMFECAALSAPMLGIKPLARLPLRGSLLLSRLLNFLSSTSYAFGQRDWAAHDPNGLSPPLSYDKVRNRVHESWMEKNEHLRVGGVTFGWIYQAIRSCAFLYSEAVLKSINTPLLIGLAGHDGLVDNVVTRRAAQFLPQAMLLEFPESGHEILMEKDAVRGQFLAAFHALVKEKIIDRPETLKPF
jgi:lysophospholipase